MNFQVRPCTLKEANRLVSMLHRHHKKVVGHRFSLALWDGDTSALIGCIICGRPVARNTDPYTTLEVLRCATNGATNAITKLYGAVCRIASESGYHAVQTFTLPEEGGASMRAAGFTLLGEAGGGQWKHTDGKPRRTDNTTVKHKWAKHFQGNSWQPARVDNQ